MKTTHFAIVLLISIGVVLGEDCKIVHPVTSSLLRCNGQNYTQTPNYMSAYNDCFAGKNGQVFAVSDILCAYERMGWVQNGKMNVTALAEHLGAVFRENAEPILRFGQSCFGEGPETAIECTTVAFHKACGHRTCDMVNTLD